MLKEETPLRIPRVGLFYTNIQGELSCFLGKRSVPNLGIDDYVFDMVLGQNNISLDKFQEKFVEADIESYRPQSTPEQRLIAENLEWQLSSEEQECDISDDYTCGWFHVPSGFKNCISQQ